MGAADSPPEAARGNARSRRVRRQASRSPVALLHGVRRAGVLGGPSAAALRRGPGQCAPRKCVQVLVSVIRRV